jgi:hypothetical protein
VEPASTPSFRAGARSSSLPPKTISDFRRHPVDYGLASGVIVTGWRLVVSGGTASSTTVSAGIEIVTFRRLRRSCPNQRRRAERLWVHQRCNDRQQRRSGTTLVAGERGEAPVVEDEQVDPRQHLAEPYIAFRRERQSFKQTW